MWPMRLHLALEDEVLAELDRKVGPRQRSAFVVAAVQAALADERRWDDLAASVGVLTEPHEWDNDPGAWVREQRRDRAAQG